MMRTSPRVRPGQKSDPGEIPLKQQRRAGLAESDPKCTVHPTLTDEAWNSTAKVSESNQRHALL
jgi:hypothetical protein